MKTLALIISFLVSVVCMEAQTITVTIDNVSSDEGKVIISLHTQSTFMKGAGIKNVETKIEGGKVVAVFEDVDPGTYAIIALHDKNSNDQMDFHENGMPKEDYGSSNNPMMYGPPVFSSSKFEMTEESKEINIRF